MHEISYSQYMLSHDYDFNGRVQVILKNEAIVPVGTSAALTAGQYIEDIAAEPGLAESYHAALIAEPPIENPGRSDEVITDAVLTAAVVAVSQRVDNG